MSYTSLLKIDGIKGDSDIPSHAGEIQVLSFRHGVHAPVTGLGHGQLESGPELARKDHEIVVSSSMGPESPKLFELAVTGRHLPKAVITFLSLSPNGTVSEYMVITMSDVIVSRIAPLEHGRTFRSDDPAPLQEMTLNYGKIEWEFKPIDEAKSTGPVKTSYDLKSIK